MSRMADGEKTIKKLSRRIHKAGGLLGLLWILLVSVSGILLNHPEPLAGFDLPRSALPGDYEYRDWNRASFRGVLPLPGSRLAVYGESGIWIADSFGRRPLDWSQGLNRTAWGRDTRALLVPSGKNSIYAATREGLYRREARADSPPWTRVDLGGEHPPVVDLFEVKGAVFALTRSDLFRSADGTSFTKIPLGRLAEPYDNPSLFRLVFDLHRGEVWGLPGRLLVDFSAVACIFFAATGFYFWWRKRRRALAGPGGGKMAREGLKYHIKLGVWLSPLLLLVTLTGMFQRPPLLIAIAFLEYPAWMHPAPAGANPWEDKFRKALYDPTIDRLVVSTSEGVHEADLAAVEAGTAKLVKVYRNPPISVMGATVFKKEARDTRGRTYLVGSMSGIFLWNRDTGRSVDALTGGLPAELAGPPVGANTAMGHAEAGGVRIWADYSRGLTDWQGRKFDWPMPAELADGGRISLWHALFELHNGRMFEALLGWWYWIVVPLTGLLFLSLIVTGLYDRLVKTKSRE